MKTGRGQKRCLPITLLIITVLVGYMLKGRGNARELYEYKTGDILNMGDYTKTNDWDTIKVLLSPTYSATYPPKYMEGFSIDMVDWMESWQQLEERYDVPTFLVFLFLNNERIVDGITMLQGNVSFVVDKVQYSGHATGFALKRGRTSFICRVEKDEYIFELLD